MLADNLWAVSFVASDLTATERATEANKRPWCGVSSGTIYETTHPIVRLHPETGERMLSLGRSVNNFVGLQRYPSQRLFERLQSGAQPFCWHGSRSIPLPNLRQLPQAKGKMLTEREPMVLHEMELQPRSNEPAQSIEITATAVHAG
ncbi:hypothetical protein LPJ38_36315 [Bradyrhizobium daqingense]|uniref:hypothetical protein n=1 Tax=Bradyrhizobium TaxID=374 RepID=UPI001E320758|nr:MULTISPECIES: hypothetical protein [Bradyrhizobium]UFS88986.1 hypothetical protein LPJ38_36315 [Bradyrhizobium daqingense]